MPDFVTFSNLRRFAAEEKISESVILNKAASISGKNVFLSHSSNDKIYLPVIIRILENNGGQVYIDDGDLRLPSKPSKDTAVILRDTIHKLDKFVLFVTTNSKDSRWIPWELGLADAYKAQRNVALMPTSENSDEQDWAEHEYLGLYRRIVWGKLQGNYCWMVYDHIENSADKLINWLSSY